MELPQGHDDKKEEENNEVAFVRWIIANLTEKDPPAADDRGYIW
jgi:hypothetical protein